jgi:hypothetical protein
METVGADNQTDAHALYLSARGPRVPWYAKWLAIIVAAYAASPIDLIPDFVPVAPNTFTCIRHMILKLDLRSNPQTGLKTAQGGPRRSDTKLPTQHQALCVPRHARIACGETKGMGVPLDCPRPQFPLCEHDAAFRLASYSSEIRSLALIGRSVSLRRYLLIICPFQTLC